ncbi:MAG: hypothetical protein RLN79_01050 [Cytophagales bacterium]
MKTGIILLSLCVSTLIVNGQALLIADWGISKDQLIEKEKNSFSFSTNDKVQYKAQINDQDLIITYQFDSLDRLIKSEITHQNIANSKKESLLTFKDIYVELIKTVGPSDTIRGIESMDLINSDLSNREAKNLINNSGNEGIQIYWKNSNIAQLTIKQFNNNLITRFNIEPKNFKISQLSKETYLEKFESENSDDLNNQQILYQPQLKQTGEHLIMAANNYNTSITIGIIGSVVAGIGLANGNESLAYVSVGASLLSVVIQYLGNAELKKAGEVMKSQNVTFNTESGFGFAVKF